MAPRLLIVEDEIGISLSLEDRFRADGYDVEIAVNGKTGFRARFEGRPSTSSFST